MKIFHAALVMVPLLALSACAGRVKECAALAGPGWTSMAAPPNAAQLLSLENMPSGSEVLWFSKGPDHALACFFATSLINPSCGGSTAYEFVEKEGHWISRSLRSQVCPVDADS